MAKRDQTTVPTDLEAVLHTPQEYRSDMYETHDIDHAVDAENETALAADYVTQSSADTDAVEQGEGRRISTAFAMKNFVADQDWIMKHVVAQGKGTHVLVGRITGYASRTERKQNKHQDKILESIAIEGEFTAEFKETGEIRDISVVYLPRAFALQIETALAMGAKTALLDVDIGLESTGKTIPYEWTVTSYLEGRAQRALRKLRQSRKIGQAAPSQNLLSAAD